MKKNLSILGAIIAAVMMLSTVLPAASPAAAEGAEQTKQYTYLLTLGTECQEYEEYEDNPCVKYWLNRSFDVDGTSTRVSIDFSVLPSGSEQDNMNTLFATGEYMDVMSMDKASQTAMQLYEEGIARDLTEYVRKYMPNYLAWEAAHPTDKLTNTVNGEERYIQLYAVSDVPEAPWGGFMYRRDWIVKYGKNPETGNAFTGGWNEDKTVWTDDVCFPSGGSDPVYISDWEWMLGIMKTALDEQGISDGYVMQLPYQGYLESGDLCSAFSGGTIGTYIADGRAMDGIPTDATRTYIEVMKNWYANGWIDPAFEERSGDMFFMIDMASVYSGKVGLWYGFSSETANFMDSGDDLTGGICVYGAAQPINDIYGDESLRNITPGCFYQQQLVTGSIIITDHVSDDDLPALLVALDYNYSREGSLIHSWGLSDEMVKESQDAVYLKLGLENGIYRLEDRDGTETIVVDKTYESVPSAGGLVGVNMVRVAGMAANGNADLGNHPVMQHAMDEWGKYIADKQVSVTLKNQLSAEQSENYSLIKAVLDPYLQQAVPNFITGREDIEDDNAWQSFCDDVIGFGSGTYAEYLNGILGE